MRTSLPPPHRRARRLLGVVGLALAVFATLGATPAGADVIVRFSEPIARGDTECDPGHEWASVPSSNWEPKVTHAVRYEHYTGGSGSYTKTATERTKVVAGLTYTTEASFSHKAVFAALEAKVGFSLHAEFERTREGSVTVTENLSKNDTYIFFSGTIKYAGPFSYYRCNSRGEVVLVNSGNVASWQIESDGAVGCTQQVPTDTVAARAKAQYCGQADPGSVSIQLIHRSPV